MDEILGNNSAHLSLQFSTHNHQHSRTGVYFYAQDKAHKDSNSKINYCQRRYPMKVTEKQLSSESLHFSTEGVD